MLDRKIVTAIVLVAAIAKLSFSQITVSILSFEDAGSSEKNRFIGKALSQMVTADLVAVDGVTFIDRSDVESVLKEQAFSLSGAVDESSAPQVGKLLGAKFLVFGNYVLKRNQINLVYKITDVETGKIKQAGTIEGQVRRLIKTKNNLTNAIYNSLKLILSDVGPFIEPVDNEDIVFEDVEKYGKALDYADKEEYENAKTILKSFNKDDSNFSYPYRSLEQLEKRIEKYNRNRDIAIDRLAEKPVRYDNFYKAASGYFSNADYTKCIAYCKSVRETGLKIPKDTMKAIQEICDYYILSSFRMMEQWDSVLGIGEKFLKMYPESFYYAGVKMFVSMGISEKEKELHTVDVSAGLEERVKKASLLKAGEATMEYMGIAGEFSQMGKWGKALEVYKKIDVEQLPSGVTPDLIFYQIFMCYYNLKDRKEARSILDYTKVRCPGSPLLESMRMLADMIGQ